MDVSFKVYNTSIACDVLANNNLHECLSGLIYDDDFSKLLAKSGEFGINPILAQFYTYHASDVPDELLAFIFNHWHQVDTDSSGDLTINELNKVNVKFSIIQSGVFIYGFDQNADDCLDDLERKNALTYLNVSFELVKNQFLFAELLLALNSYRHTPDVGTSWVKPFESQTLTAYSWNTFTVIRNDWLHPDDSELSVLL